MLLAAQQKFHLAIPKQTQKRTKTAPEYRLGNKIHPLNHLLWKAQNHLATYSSMPRKPPLLLLSQ
jgi:hypothetical protein